MALREHLVWQPRVEVQHRATTRLLLGVCGGLLTLYLAGLGICLAAALAYPYPLHFEEGTILSGVAALLQGGSPYGDDRTPPYLAGIYPPLHFLLLVGPAALGGLSLTWLRLVPLLSTILLALLIYRWVWERSASRAAAILAAGCLLTFFPIANWAASIRTDSTAVLFSLAGAYAVDRHWRDRRLWWAVLLFVLAFYTKQSQLAAPAAAVAFLIIRAPRRAVRFLAAYLLGLGGSFLLGDLLTGHQLYRHLVDYNSGQPAWVWRARQLYKSYVVAYGGYMLLAAGGALVLARRNRLPFLGLYLATSSLATVSLVAAGSDFNHLMESAAVITLLAGLGLGHALTARAPWLPLAGAAILALQLALRAPSTLPGLAVPWLPLPDEHGRGAGTTEPPLWLAIPDPVAKASGDRLVGELAATRGPVLLEQSAFGVLAGHPAVLDDLFVFTTLANSGKWSQEAVLSQLRQRQIALIALQVDLRPADVHHTRLTDQMIAAIKADYQLTTVLPYPGLEGPAIYLYRPRTSARG